MLPPPPRSTLFPYTTLFRSDPQFFVRQHYLDFLNREPDADGLAFCVWFTVDRKSTRLNSSHRCISYAVFCLKKKKKQNNTKNIHLTTHTANNSVNTIIYIIT